MGATVVSFRASLARREYTGAKPGAGPDGTSDIGCAIMILLSHGGRPIAGGVHPECEAWADKLEQADTEALLAAIRVVRDQGPTLGRPLVDTVQGSRHSNMKELRPGSTGRT
jgi:hypothetical protein